MRAARVSLLGAALGRLAPACDGSSTTEPGADGGAAPAGPGAWANVADLPGTARHYPGVAAARGRVFVLGGSAFGAAAAGPERTAADAYDPAANTWESLPPLPIASHMANAAAVGDRLFVVGALGVAAVHEYDFSAKAWRARTAMPFAEGRGAAAVGVDGKRILIAGGVIPGAAATGLRQADVAAYDTEKDAWEALPPMLAARGYAAGAVAGKRFWVMGGSSNESQLVDVDTYDLQTKTWTAATSLPAAVSSAAAAVAGGRIYLMGGLTMTGASPVTGATLALDPARETWTVVAPMATARYGLGAAAQGGRIYAVGGVAQISATAFGATPVVEAFTP